MTIATILIAATLASGGWHDLNHNGKRDPYEDPRAPIEKRLDDLIGQMTIEEKVGSMLHGSLPALGNAVGASVGAGSGYDLAKAEALIDGAKITSFITRLAIPPQAFAENDNAVQKIAARTRLGIPITISSDPRNHFQAVLGASTAGGGFSLWPETLGFGALGDAATVRRFGQIVRQEYRAVGIHMALSPQADLFTEPRWPRGTGTFGSDAATVSRLAGAYVEGFQGGASGLKRDGVATVVKHWVGYGAEPAGFDGHNIYGQRVTLDQQAFANHIAAFKGPLAAKSAGVMPTYVIVDGVTIDGKPNPSVGAGFSKPLLDDLLRGTHRFGGLIVSDWGITSDCTGPCAAPTAEARQLPPAIGMPWGVEKLSQEDRFALGVNAGIDQFGGFDNPAPLLAAVRSGKISMARLDQSVRRVMRLKFEQGLFDDAQVDAAAAGKFVGNPAFQAEADRAQRAAQVVLENKQILPLTRKRVWLVGVAPAAARAAGLDPVDDPAKAEVAIVRIAAPFERLHPYHFFGGRQNEGRLDYRDGDPALAAVKRVAAAVPTIVAVDMDRPAILTEIKPLAAALIAVFGASDAALLDVVTGKAAAKGRLPFELPSSMAAVEKQNPALPDDSEAPLYKRGAGIVGR